MIKASKVHYQAMVGAAAIMLAALLWSLDGVFIRPKFYIFPASLVVFLEHFLGFIVLSPFIVLSWKKIKLLNSRDWGAIIWVSFFGGLLGTIMITQAFFAAVHGEVTFATVVILQKLQPVFALLLARVVLKEKLSKQFYFWALLAIISAYLLAFGKSGLDLREIDWAHNASLFAVLAAFAFGSSTVFGKRIVNHLDFKSVAGLRFGLTSLLALVVILLNGNILAIKELNSIHWIYLLVIVFSSGAAAIFIYYFGLKKVTASTATICELFWPLSAVILDYLLNGNILNASQIIASIILLIAFYQVIKKGQIKNFKFSAKKIYGRGRGERLGFPTINLDAINLDIAHGVYLVKVSVGNIDYQGLLHFGQRETFSEEASVELLLKNNIRDCDDKIFKIEIIKKIREIKKFDTIENLSEQINKDKKYLT